MAENGHRRSLPAKPEAEIWRKPDKWTRNHRLPIRLRIHYGVYLDAMWRFTREGLPLRPCKQALDFEIFGHQVRKIVGGEGVSKCVIFDVDSIFGVRILSENFSHYTTVVGLRTFAVWRCESAFLSFSKPICSETTQLISVKFSHVVGGRILPRWAESYRNRKFKSVEKLGQIYEKLEYS